MQGLWCAFSMPSITTTIEYLRPMHAALACYPTHGLTEPEVLLPLVHGAQGRTFMPKPFTSQCIFSTETPRHMSTGGLLLWQPFERV